MSKVDNPVMLVVLDGWGHSLETRHNAIHAAQTPNWDRLWADYPHLLLDCSGTAVGLLDQQMGNSEVGHVHLGAGRVVDQDYTRITNAIEDGSFFDNQVLKAALQSAADRGRAVHMIGLVSPGGVHGHEDHLLAAITLAASHGVEKLFIHAILDGRDVPPSSAMASIEKVLAGCAKARLGDVVSVVGRYYAMDRNTNWERTELAYKLIVDGSATQHAEDAVAAVSAAYGRGETDEFVAATTVTVDGGKPVGINDGDTVIFLNFRADRARQLVSAMTDPAFDQFARRRPVEFGTVVTMTYYGARYNLPIAFPIVGLSHPYGEVIAAHGLRQLRVAETEKYAHVTYFFNGGAEQPFAGEDRILIPSPDVATYDLRPEMSAAAVTDALIAAIQSRVYDTIICNYANADMVGHTGIFAATVKCIEVLDACLGRLVSAAVETGTEVLITADHGNAEKMLGTAAPGDKAQPHTAHTNNPVPLIYIGRQAKAAGSGALSDIAPTMLALMHLEQPQEMTGRSLFKLLESTQHAA